MTHKTMLRTGIAGLALAACLAAVSPVLAETVTFKASLRAVKPKKAAPRRAAVRKTKAKS